MGKGVFKSALPPPPPPRKHSSSKLLETTAATDPLIDTSASIRCLYQLSVGEDENKTLLFININPVRQFTLVLAFQPRTRENKNIAQTFIKKEKRKKGTTSESLVAVTL